MARLSNLLLLTLAGSVMAFGLQSQRMPKTSLRKTSNGLARHTTVMMSDVPVDVVAAKKEEPKKTFISTIWNDSTQLFTYLSVWYLGNIYCKSLNIQNSCTQ